MNLNFNHIRRNLEDKRGLLSKPIFGSKRTILGNLDLNRRRSKSEKKKETPFVKNNDMISTKNSPKVDKVHEKNPQAVSELVKDIYATLKKKENKYAPAPKYMDLQKDLSSNMRRILIDWLIDVHYKFNLLPETLYLTINIIDRFLSMKGVSRSKLQLVGVTSLLLASKYEEIFPPDVRRLLSISANVYTRSELLNMERLILSTLSFNLTVVTPYQFHARLMTITSTLSHSSTLSSKIAVISRYFDDIAMQEYKYLKYSPSLRASTSVYLAHHLCNKSWTTEMEHYSGYTAAQMKECAKFMLEDCVSTDKSTKLVAIRKKYSRKKRFEISTFIPQKCKTMGL